MSDFAAPETTGEFPHEEAEAIAMMKFLESIVATEPDARRTLIDVATVTDRIKAGKDDKSKLEKTVERVIESREIP